MGADCYDNSAYSAREPDIAFRSDIGIVSDMSDLTHLVQPGRRLEVRVTPKASRNAVILDGDKLRVMVTTVPEGGKANAEVIRHLAKALGIAKSRLTLLRGGAGRDKLFQID